MSDWRLQRPEIHLKHLAVSVCRGFTPVGWPQDGLAETLSLPRHSISPSSRRPPDFINALIRKWSLQFLFTNKQISLCI